jgi:putative spermidine/putrescine transport system permease protein
LLRFLGGAAVTLILGFLLLPGLVVTLAAFNSRAILSFPPESWSWRWFAKALAYEDFQAGFRNGLIVTAWASSIALVVGAAFAFALDRYEFRLKRALETVLLSPLVVPHFTIGLGFLILAAQVGLARGYAVVVACHVVLVLPFVLRSVYISLRNLDPRLELAAASLAVRDITAHANPPGCPLQLRARIRRPLDGRGLGHLHSRHRKPADIGQRLSRSGKGPRR